MVAIRNNIELVRGRIGHIENEELASALERESRPVLELNEILKADSKQHESTEKSLRKEKTRAESRARELEKFSSLDSLTNIANRRRFDHLLSVEWRRALRTQGSLTLIILDIDYFK